jgi:hypothetical protein
MPEVDAPMTDATSAGDAARPAEATASPENRTTSSAPGVAAAALIVGVGANQIAAEAEEADRSPNAPGSKAGRSVVRQREHGGRGSRRRFVRPATSPAPALRVAVAKPGAAGDTTSELRDWIKDNATLLSNASLLISIAALALGLLPDTGILDPYIKALIFGAALLLLIEMHHQWPEDLQLHMLRRNARPENHSWRMTAFAFLMQIATLIFAVWATLNSPLILIPLTALAVVLAFRQWYFRRYTGVLTKSFGILALVAVLVLSEVLMAVVWAVVANQEITIEFWAEDRPGLNIEVLDPP